MITLTIETSCDETSAAVIQDGKKVLGSVVATQIPIHSEFGGVVPELASRNHSFLLPKVIDNALNDAQVTLEHLDGFAATAGPGLVGSLLVGLETAKTLAYAYNKPFVGVNHLEGHLSTIFLDCHDEQPTFPYIGVVVSGGHTDIYLVRAFSDYLILGRTRDDAAGEAYDKVAKMLGLGYPGGPIIQRLAESATPTIDFPSPMLDSNDYDFSFSGLKTAVRNYLLEHKTLSPTQLADVVASFQKALVHVIITKALKAAKAYKDVKHIVFSGGVACNTYLREQASTLLKKHHYQALFPLAKYCTDNAAMLGPVANFYLEQQSLKSKEFQGWDIAPYSSSQMGVTHHRATKNHR